MTTRPPGESMSHDMSDHLEREMFDAALSAAIAFAASEVMARDRIIENLTAKVERLDAENVRLREERRGSLRARVSSSEATP